MRLSLTCAGLTHQGRVRTHNEDRWLADPRQRLFLVADGLGGHVAGALAAQQVVETLPALLAERLRGIADLDDPETGVRLRAALGELSDQVRCANQNQPGRSGLGATVVLALLRKQQAFIAHMGDSRAYLLRKGRLELLTRDHSLVQLLLDCGEITPKEAADHPARGRLTRYIGMAGEPLPEVRVLTLALGDRLLLCSDGLTGMVSQEALHDLLGQGLPPREICGRLIQTANTAGGQDNITAVVLAIG